MTSATARPMSAVLTRISMLDPGVVLDLGHRGPDHVEERDRVAPAAAGRLAGQDDQALRVPPHPGGQVVDAEQVVELVGLLRPALHAVEQGELPLQQRAGSAGPGYGRRR